MDPTLRKKMVVCTPFGEYVNGDMEGKMTTKRLKALAANFSKYPRQVPIYALGDHVTDLDERLPDGWVEGLSVNESGELVADVKIMGQAAAFILQDMIRGASIGTVQGKNPDGSPQGEVLQHLLLTNNPFDKSLNIAAAQKKGGEAVLSYFSALPNKEATMAEVDEGTQPPADEAVAAQLKEKDDEIVRLRHENLELKEKLENATVDEEKHELALRVAKLERKTIAQEVRETVFKMLREGTIKPSKVDGYAKGGDEGTLAWFKASIFNGDMRLLKFAADHNPPVFKVGSTFKSGIPEQDSITLSDDDRSLIRKLGLDHETVIAGMKSTTRAEFDELTAKEK